MSGHSKWSKVKHQKALTDTAKGSAFTKASRAITVAVREGGGITDPNGNFRLRLAIEGARAVNMPKETIQRAIDKGRGAGEGAIEQVIYEAYGPGGVAILIEVATDNRNRIVSIIKNTLEHIGGSLASPGAVAFLFTRTGIITVPKSQDGMDTILAAAIDAGAQDVTERDDVFELYIPVPTLSAAHRKLLEKGIMIDNVQIILNPLTIMELPQDKRVVIETLVAQLAALDDVQRVYTNI